MLTLDSLNGRGVENDSIAPEERWQRQYKRALRVQCPICRAKPFRPCVDMNGREVVKWYHSTRGGESSSS